MLMGLFYFLFGLLLAISLVMAAWLLLTERTREAYALFGFVLLIVVVVYAVGVLDFKVSALEVTAEKAVRDLEVTRSDFVKVTSTLIRLNAEMNAKSDYMGTFGEHIGDPLKIRQYLEVVGPYLDEEALANLERFADNIEERDERRKRQEEDRKGKEH